MHFVHIIICTCTVCTYEYELKYVCPQEQQLSVVPSMEEEVVQYKCRMLSVPALNQDSLNAHTQTHLKETTRGMWLCTASPGQQQVYISTGICVMPLNIDYILTITCRSFYA